MSTADGPHDAEDVARRDTDGHRLPPDDVVLRAGSMDDFEALCRVHDAARPLELAGSCDPRAFLPLRDDPESQELPEYDLVVAERGGEVVGFAGVRRAYIGWLYVHPQHHGLGIGRALLRRVMAIGGEDSWTLALVNNHTARALYASEGFGVLETIDGNNAGYSCVGVKLALDADDDMAEAGDAPSSSGPPPPES